ncbi:MAG: hypothetical protein OXK76_18455 [Gammaproteobacteria bacterium]|nr:hypothetical protein [Gammaproteobacteria bacterium]
MAKTPDWMDAHAARNLELTLQALAAGEYGEPYLDLDTDRFRKYRAGQQDALLSETWRDKPIWDLLMSRVRPGDRVLCLARASRSARPITCCPTSSTARYLRDWSSRVCGRTLGLGESPP